MYRLSPGLIAKLHVKQEQYPDQEIGFGLNVTETGELEIVKMFEGEEKSVLFTEHFPVEAHTHPRGIYGVLVYHPPSSLDYEQALLSYFSGNEYQIVVDDSGLWVYRPNKALIEYIIKIQPDISLKAKKAKFVPEKGFMMLIGEEMHKLLEIIRINTGIDGIALTQPPSVIKTILKQNKGILPGNYLAITVDEYINRIAKAVDGEEMGFIVNYHPSNIFLPILS